MTKIPLPVAEFFYSAEPGEMPTEFIASNRTERLIARKSGQPDFTSGFRQSNGSHVQGWLVDKRATPAGIFAGAYLSRLPAEQIERILLALHEIANVEGQEWAEQMVALLETPPRPWRSNR
jgi:hypothetical protein